MCWLKLQIWRAPWSWPACQCGHMTKCERNSSPDVPFTLGHVTTLTQMLAYPQPHSRLWNTLNITHRLFLRATGQTEWFMSRACLCLKGEAWVQVRRFVSKKLRQRWSSVCRTLNHTTHQTQGNTSLMWFWSESGVRSQTVSEDCAIREMLWNYTMIRWVYDKPCDIKIDVASKVSRSALTDAGSLNETALESWGRSTETQRPINKAYSGSRGRISCSLDLESFSLQAADALYPCYRLRFLPAAAGMSQVSLQIQKLLPHRPISIIWNIITANSLWELGRPQMPSHEYQNKAGRSL